MPVLDLLVPSVALGMALAVIVAVTLRLLTPMNAATRSLVWLVTLFVLPLILFTSLLGIPSFLSRRPSAAPQPPPPPFVRTSTLRITPARQPESMPVAIPSPASGPVQISVPQNLPEGLLALYGVIVVSLLLRLFVSYLRLCFLRRRTEAAGPELASRLHHWLGRCPTKRKVELRLSQTARSPIAIGWLRPIIVMPAALILELSQDDFDNLGVHELAHLRRYDDWTNLAQRLIQAFLFFHPAVHYVARKLNFEREVACDDWVVSRHESKSYALCLAKVAELRRYRSGALLLSSGAFFGKRQIFKRVAALLDKTRNSATQVSSLTVVAILVILVAVATQVVNLPAVVAFTQEENNSTNIRWSDGSRDFNIKYRGDVSFSPDEQSVASISPNGFLAIDESKGWSHRRIEVRPNPAGAPEEKYFIDGREKPLDGVGRAWTAGAYLFLLREVGIDAEARVGRILARRGPNGVLEEVDLIHSDHVKCEYLNQLMEQTTLSTPDLQRLADRARKISSDNDKADFLLAHQREFASPDLRSSYFRAVNSLSSDNDRRRVLTGVLESGDQSPETARFVGLSAKAMSSDNDKAEVLLAIPPATSAGSHCAMLKAARTISSDNDKARVLRDPGYVDSTQCRDDYFAVVNLISSDNDRSNVLQSLLKQPDLQPQTYVEIANSAKTISSDNDKANVLALLGVRYSGSSFFDAATTIQSSGDRARVLRSIVEHANSTPALLGVIQSAATISSDNDKADVLLAVAKQSNETAIRTALQKACQTLGSDNDYRRVASAIFESSTRESSDRQDLTR